MFFKNKNRSSLIKLHKKNKINFDHSSDVNKREMIRMKENHKNLTKIGRKNKAIKSK